MRIGLFLILLQSVCAGICCVAQQREKNNIYLTGYVITAGSDVVGYVKANEGSISSVTLSGENARAFKVTKDYALTVQASKLKPGTVYDVTLTVTTPAGKQEAVFRIVKDNFIRNKVIAHRGAWKNTGAAENSIAALEHAVKLGCEGSEFDVHMSADSVPVINHDASIQGVSIARTDAAQLLTMKLASGETLPTLENYLKAGMGQNKTKLILEIKPSELGQASSIALTRKVVALVEQLHAQAWVDYISFDYEVCKEVLLLAPYAKVAYLKGDKSPADLAADKFYGLDYHFSILQKNPGWVGEARDKKLTINVWTVNDKPVLEDLLKQNVDFITTNEPELLLSMIKK
jgi:glycerophosphoryl diester phosphodiesterase